MFTVPDMNWRRLEIFQDLAGPTSAMTAVMLVDISRSGEHRDWKVFCNLLL